MAIYLYKISCYQAGFDLYCQNIDPCKTSMNKTPQKNQLMPDNLYEIHSCSICLMELTSDIASLSCGHCFHFLCIKQQFENSGTCPNCRKRAYDKEIRTIIFPVELNNKSMQYLKSLIQKLGSNEKNQIENLLKELKIMNEQRVKDQNSIKELEQTSQNRLKQVLNLKDETNMLKIKREEEMKNFLEFVKVNKKLEKELSEMQKTQIYTSIELNQLRDQKKELDNFKKIRKAMTDTNSAQQILKIKQKFENDKANPNEVIKMFFDLSLMKNLECSQLKKQVKEFPIKLENQNNIIRSMKNEIESYRNKEKEINEKKSIERRKYEELKKKYAQLCSQMRNKYRQNELPSFEDSNGFNLALNELNKKEDYKANMNSSLNNSITSFNPNTIIEESIQIAETKKPKKPSLGSMSYGSFNLKRKNGEEKVKNSITSYLK